MRTGLQKKYFYPLHLSLSFVLRKRSLNSQRESKFGNDPTGKLEKKFQQKTQHSPALILLVCSCVLFSKKKKEFGELLWYDHRIYTFLHQNIYMQNKDMFFRMTMYLKWTHFNIKAPMAGFLLTYTLDIIWVAMLPLAFYQGGKVQMDFGQKNY